MGDSLALTRMNGSALPSRTRTNVPAFLNKLYSMVSDPETDDLIRWADDGESFLVPNHEKLGREVLPRFFKHGNFASFVRQLNMYGFHKVPQLQQGVLKNETETELWQFTEPNFQRDRPDLLDNIQRKKGPSVGSNQASIDSASVGTRSNSALGAASNATTNIASAGPLALQSLASELSSIKMHQSNIISELQTLQVSNHSLWQETLAAQERHKKQQDTIERILKFLASVFGNPSSHGGSSRTGGGNSGTVHRSPAPRHKGLLMIDNGRSPTNKPPSFSRDTVSPVISDSSRFSEANTPLDISATDSVSPPRVMEDPTSASMDRVSQPVTSPNQVARRTPTRGYTTPLRSLTPQPTETTPNDKPNDNDLAFRASLASILNSSSSPQRLLATLSQLPTYNGGDSSLSQYQPSPLEYPPDDLNNHASDFHVSDYLNPSPTGVDTFPNRFIEPSDPNNELYYTNPNPALSVTAEGLRKAYQSAQDVDADVDNLQINLESFMESLGMNSSAFDSTTPPSMDIFTNGDVEAAVNGDPFTVPYDGVVNISAPSDSSTEGGVGGTPGEENGPSVDIDSLFDQITTAASDGNSFDTSQYTTQDPQSIAQQAAILPELGKVMKDSPISPLKTTTILSTPSEPPSSPTTIHARSPRLKRKSEPVAPSVDGSVRGSNSPERRDPVPPLKKARVKRKKV